MFSRLCSTLFLLILAFNVSGQDDNNVFRADLRGHYGFIMVHRDNMSHLVKGHPMMVELSISKPTFGKSQWEQVYNFPELGVSFLYAGLENKKQLGPVYAIFPYINFKLNQSDFCNFRLRIGSGIGYFPVTFDVLNNHKNLAISSHLNGAVNFLFLNRIRLTNKMSLENGIAFTHFSNGDYKMPNLGINIVTVNSGLSLLIGDATKTPTKGLLLPHSKSLDYGIIGTVGIKALEAEGKKYPVYTFRTFIDKSISYKSSVGAGLDLGYNTSIIDRLVYDNIIVTKKTSIIQPGVNLAYTVKINNLSLFINKGIYLNRIDVRSGIFYHRLGIRYKFNNRLIANVSLKTHFGIADHFEYGLGYKFNK